MTELSLSPSLSPPTLSSQMADCGGLPQVDQVGLLFLLAAQLRNCVMNWSKMQANMFTTVLYSQPK